MVQEFIVTRAHVFAVFTAGAKQIMNQTFVLHLQG
jgi:hypothetical protein